MTWEPDYDVWDITVDEGKYRFRSLLNREHPDAGPSRTRDAWRSGEWWEGGTEWLRTMHHMKSFASLMTEFNTARRALEIIRSYRAIMHAVDGLVGEKREVVMMALTQVGPGPMATVSKTPLKPQDVDHFFDPDGDGDPLDD